MKHIIFTAILGALTGGVPVVSQDDTAKDLIWWDVKNFGVEGQGWRQSELESPYDRLPSKAQDIVRGAVWNLSRHSAGLSFRFRTDATDFVIRYQLGGKPLDMPHMPATGVSGVDLYALNDDGSWGWVEVARPQDDKPELKVHGLKSGMRTYLAYLPLYNSVKAIEVGIPEGNTFEAVTPRESKPIVFYGTSITQGACASRPGMSHVAILGRRLDIPVINLGFSGNGKMEPELTALLGELEPAVYVIDCLPNMTADEVASNTPPLVRKLKEIRPEVPILLVEDRSYANAWIHPSQDFRNRSSREALAKAYEELKASGIEGLHYLEGDRLLGEDGEGTTDGSHPNDLGFMRQADAFEKALEGILD